MYYYDGNVLVFIGLLILGWWILLRLGVVICIDFVVELRLVKSIIKYYVMSGCCC